MPVRAPVRALVARSWCEACRWLYVPFAVAELRTTQLGSPIGSRVPSSTEQSKQPAPVKYINKQRVLVLSSRGVTSRFRHLMEDLRNMIPHHKKDAKVRGCGLCCTQRGRVLCGVQWRHHCWGECARDYSWTARMT